MRIQRHLSFLAMALAVLALTLGAFANRSTAAHAQASFGSATITVTGGSAAQGGTVDVPVNLTSFTPGTSTTWGGYDLEISYDPAVVHPTADVIGGSNPCGIFWANTVLSSPNHVVSGCSFQSSTFTGVLETITFTCQMVDAATAITLVPVGDADQTDSGTRLFDESANSFAMSLTDDQIVCGSGTANSPTPTFTATASGPTNTPTATKTATSTPAPATQTAVAATSTAAVPLTQTAQANFGGASTATPPAETRTAIAAETQTAGPTDTPAAGGEQPTTAPPPPPPGGGGTTGPGGAPGGVINLPDTGSAGGGHSMESLWLIIAGVALAAAGAGLFVKSLRVR